MTRESGISVVLLMPVILSNSYKYRAQIIQFNKYILHNNYGGKQYKINSIRR